VRAPRAAGEAVGPRLRAGWKFLIFLALYVGLGRLAAWAVLSTGYKPPRGFTAEDAAIAEIVQFAIALVASWVLSRIEARSLADYGLPARGAFGAKFWEGTLWGLGAVTALFLMVLGAGGARVSGLAIHGAALWHYLLLWTIAMIGIGLFEELTFRGTPLYTLAGGMGFWPAAILLSLVFGGLHFFFKPMENLVDAASVTLLGLFMALALRRTGSLWFPIGFHVGFDWAALFFYSAPNTANEGQPLVGHFLAVEWKGPAWINGGPLGLEASVFVFVVIAALYLGLNARYQQARWPVSQGPAAAL
jgi:uncharacterized protein